MSAVKEFMRNNSSRDESLKPATIMRNVYNVFPSLAMLAGMQLDLFTPLKDGPMEAKTLAEALKVQEEKLRPILYLLVAADLLMVESGRFSNTEESANFLVSGRPEYIGGLSGFFNMIWSVSLKTAESIRTGKPQAKVDFQAWSDEELLVYFQKQIHSSIRGGREIAEKFDFSKFESLLDAGGGTGGVAIAICNQYPNLKATVADLPKVAKLAGHFIAEAGLSDRIGVEAVDLGAEAPAGKYDIAILRALIQTISMEESMNSLKHVGEAMSPGGLILIFGNNILDNSRLGPLSPLTSDLGFLNLYDHGRSYTENEYRDMLTQAGFADIAVEHGVLVDGMGMSLVSAKKKM